MKKMTIVLGVLMGVALTSIGLSVAHDGDEGFNDSRIRRGFEIAPVSASGRSWQTRSDCRRD